MPIFSCSVFFCGGRDLAIKKNATSNMNPESFLFVFGSSSPRGRLPVAAHPVPAALEGGPRRQRAGAAPPGGGQTSSPHTPHRGLCHPGGSRAFPCKARFIGCLVHEVTIKKKKNTINKSSCSFCFDLKGRRAPQRSRLCTGRPRRERPTS